MKKKLISFFTQKGYYLLLLYWWVFRPHRKGVRVIVVSNGRVLMVRPAYLKNARWTFPGGGIKKGETLEEAARREVREETGIEIGAVRFIAPLVSDKEYKIDHISLASAEALDRGAIRIQDTLEIAEASWFSFDTLPPMGPIAKGILSTYLENKK